MKIKHLTIILPGLMLILAFFGQPQMGVALDPGFSIEAPATAALPDLSWSLNQQQSTIDFATPIVVSNAQSNSGGFTVQVSATEFIEGNDPTLFIGYDKLEIKTGAVTTDQPDGVTTPLNNTYTAFYGATQESSKLDLMVADNRNRNAGSWSITPSLRLNVPPKQKSGNYLSTITFSLI